MGPEKRLATGRRARHAHLHSDICHGHSGQREHVHSDRPEQVHAHGHQLLSVQSCRVRPVAVVVRVAAGDLPDMVQV